LNIPFAPFSQWRVEIGANMDAPLSLVKHPSASAEAAKEAAELSQNDVYSLYDAFKMFHATERLEGHNSWSVLSAAFLRKAKI
jgi:hypothetical protein